MTVQVFSIDAATKRSLAAKLRQGEEVIRFADDPALASLRTCIGLQSEVGQPGLDRLSPFFGVDGNPWRSQLLMAEHEIGIQWWREDGVPLQLRHVDFRHVMDRSSFDREGRLTSVVIYPARVASNFRQRGFELVVVRDWMLTSSLSDDDTGRVNYLHANDWEIRNIVGRMQAKLMQRRQLVFSGTHDIVDHLLNADVQGYATALPTVSVALETLAREFPRETEVSTGAHVIAYLLAVVLDDLAQPRWYRSTKHQWMARELIASFPAARRRPWNLQDGLPAGFHAAVDRLRAPVPHEETVVRRGSLVEQVFANR